MAFEAKLTPEQWTQARTDYVQKNMSQVKLGAKYGVSPAAINKRAQREGWQSLRLAYQTGKREEALQAVTINQLRKLPAEMIEEASLALLQKVIDRIALMTEDELSPNAVKQLTGAIKDLKDILIKEDDGPSQIEVVFKAGDDAFNG